MKEFMWPTQKSFKPIPGLQKTQKKTIFSYYKKMNTQQKSREKKIAENEEYYK